MPPYSTYKVLFLVGLVVTCISMKAGASTIIISNLSHTGNNPQQIKELVTPTVDVTEMFTVNYNFSFSLDPTYTGNYGFRNYMESQNSGSFSFAWKSDVNGGSPTFYGGSGTDYQVSGSDWNLSTAFSSIESDSFEMSFIVSPEAGQNPGQYSGTYYAVLKRASDGASITTSELSWTGSNISPQQYDEVVFYNSASGLTVDIGTLSVGTSTIPEPTAYSLSLLALSALTLRRRR